MSNWRKDAVRGFMAMIGLGLTYAGIVTTKMFAFWFYGSFILLGLVFIGAAVYWWYRDNRWR